ncbi:DUF2066 domain-containing protein [Shewanella cyperi]|uniref:DUF2066 domain-containing protein n=1 Tax=Shewanella cyperi TaxID=2814292 RepID=A0A974XND9_9GAMM|nr:DUF2066 domain-containing protein [Shewanella cyperi]QSX31544.1 DUF2066 domain-containing protein [Shewanella cyperi]
MRNKFLSISLLISLLAWQGAQAVEVAKLDEADVQVGSRSASERDSAVREALALVLVKNSGSAAVLEHPLIRQQLSSASALLRQYSYLEKERQLYVHASFDQARIVSLLRDAQLPVWGKQRPLTLMWLVVERDGERALLADQGESVQRQLLMQAAENAGIPVLLPLMDLDDLMQVSVNSVRGMFVDEVMTATNRYQSDFFVLANMEAAGETVNYQLSLYSRPREGETLPPQALLSQQGSAASEDQAMSALLSLLSSFYVEKYAVTSTGESQLSELTFVGINKLADLVSLEAFLGQLSVVKSVSLKQMAADKVTFNLSLFGTREDLDRLLNLEGKISRLDSLQDEQANTYQWRGQ